ncbi:MAG: hypothetical protein NXI04_11980 [Planctomycetaceae bacterium]|nr:hypothetical protein [Planctomycetaceae bacterium]
MLRAKISHLLACSAIMLTSLTAYGQSTKVISDQILPQDTYLYLSFPNITQMKSHMESSSLGQLWDDPALDEFKAELHNAFDSDLQEGLMQVQEAVGMSVEELMQIPNGEMTIAVSGGPSNTMGVILFLDFGDKESQVSDLVERAAGAMANVPQLVREDESFDGTDLTMFRVQYNGPTPTPLAKEFGWFMKDERLVFANRIELLESVLSNWDGEGSDSFATNEQYSYIMGKCQTGDRTALTTLYMDPIGLFKKLVQTGSLGQQATMGAGMAVGFLPTLGLDQMKAFGSVSEAGKGPFAAISRGVFYADQPPMNVMEIFQLDSTDPTPPDWVKDNVTAYISTKWKIGEAFSAVENLVDMFSGPGTFADRLNQIADREPGIHIKHDIVEQMTGDIKVITAPGEGAGYGGDQVLFALGVRDDEGAGAVLSKIANAAGMDSRDFRGSEIFEVEGPDNQSVKLTVSQGRMLLCIGGPLLEQVLLNDSDMKPLSASEDFRKIAEHFPASALSVQFSRPAEQYRGLYEMLRSGEAADQFPGMDEIFAKLDFTTLPPYEAVSRYIKPSGGFTKEDENGMYMEAFQLKD